MLETENVMGTEVSAGVQTDEIFSNTVPDLKEINELAERLDFFDVVVLKKFYLSGKDPLSSTRPHCFPILFKEMKDLHKMKLGIEAFRKRLKVLTKMGLLIKVEKMSPTAYLPVPEKEFFIKASITKFFLINGVTKFV